MDSIATLADLAHEQHRRNTDAIDTMCRRMMDPDINPKRHGVKVVDNPDLTVTVTLDPEVPFGTVGYQR